MSTIIDDSSEIGMWLADAGSSGDGVSDDRGRRRAAGLASGR
jgi:hypothetical protein